ncbi:MAG: DUF805 domain-containing protein [Cyclobacteriaceae bacterium]
MNNESFFSPKGRVRRGTYFLRSLLLGIPTFLVNLLGEDLESISGGILIFMILFVLILTVLQVFQMIKRLHDADMSGWFGLLCLVPLVNLGLAFILLFKDGTPGPNKYGEDPKGREALAV